MCDTLRVISEMSLQNNQRGIRNIPVYLLPKSRLNRSFSFQGEKCTVAERDFTNECRVVFPIGGDDPRTLHARSD